MARIDKERLQVQNKINEGLKEQDRLTKNLAEVLNEQLRTSKKVTDDIKDRTKFLEDMVSSDNKSLDINERMNKLKGIAVGLEKKLTTGRNAKGQFVSKSQVQTQKDINNVKLKGLKVQKFQNDAFKMGDDLTDGMLEKAKGFLNPWTAALAVIVLFSGKIDAIGQSFGSIGVKSSSITNDLLDAEKSAVGLGKSMDDVVSSISTLTAEFGTGFAESRKMAAGIIDTSVALGLGVSEGAQLIGTFTTLSGLSTDTADKLAKQTALLAEASDVAPQQVLKDIAGSSETVAKFTSASGENIALAAIQARKLGIDLNTAASAAESMLDFNGAVQKSMEASVLLGREINVGKLQELSLAGNLKGVALEQRNLLGSQSDFLAMNVIQRKALAGAVGLSVEQAAKMLDHEKESVSLAGELSSQKSFDQMLGKDAISNLTQIVNSFKEIGSSVVQMIGPTLNVMVGTLGTMVGWAVSLEEKFRAVSVVMGALLIKSLISASATIFKSFAAIPFGLGIPLAIGATAALYQNVAKAKSTKMAEGGIVTSETLATVGEAGPEAVIPLNKGGENVFNAQGIIDAINSLKLTTTITNKQLQVMLITPNG
jgi:hypothetical protein